MMSFELELKDGDFVRPFLQIDHHNMRNLNTEIEVDEPLRNSDFFSELV